MAKKRKTPAQPGQDWNAPAAELLAEHSGKPESWVMSQVRAKYPPFDDWLKLKQ